MIGSHLVLDGDYSDPDVIRVGETYWMITSTIHCSPAMAVLRSTDLQTWEHVGHCLPDLAVLGPAYSHAAMGSRFGRGVYAGSIRRHAGRYWVHFTTLDDGIFVVTAEDPSGPWSDPVRLTDETMWDDPCPLWGSDGESWLVASRPGPEKWFTYLIPMAADGFSIDLPQAVVLDDHHTSEGNKIYLIEDHVFVLHNEVRAPGHRVAVIMRASSVHGPWEKRILWEGTGVDRDREPNQGALVDHADGSWSFVTHHGRCGYPEGRPVSIFAVTWDDGWPVVQADPPTTETVTAGSPSPRDDQFVTTELAPVWEWTNAPVTTHWSLTERAGHLRLFGHPAARADGLVTAANVCTQRVRSTAGSAQVTIDASALMEGTVAGLCVYSTTRPVGIGVCRQNGGLRVVLIEGDRLTDGDLLADDAAVTDLRVDVDARGFAAFATSSDRETWSPLGDSFPLRFAHYRGARLGLFCLGTTTESGHADFTDFRYTASPATSRM